MAEINILLVDDEQYVIDGIKRNLPSKMNPNDFLCELGGVDTCIYSATNISKAKEIIQTCPIQVVICDIVMPQGTGFELLDWVRQNEYSIEVIFLTSYADFNYAQKAIALECVDYLLKPVDYEKLHEIIQKAIEKVLKKHSFIRYQEESNERLKEDLLARLLTAEEQADIENLAGRLKTTDMLLPCLIHFYFESLEQSESGALIIKIRQILGELTLESGFQIELVQKVEHMKYIVLIAGAKENSEDRNALEAIFDKLLLLLDKIHADVWCGIGKPCQISSLSAYVRKLIVMRESNLTIWNKVVCMDNVCKDEGEPLQVQYKNPYVSVWKVLLEEKEEEKLLHQIYDYLGKMEEAGEINSDMLHGFRIDFLQCLYSFLAEKEIRAHLLFHDAESEDIYRKCVEGLKGCRKFVESYVRKTFGYLSFINETKSVIDILCQYLDSNYKYDIGREDLAKVVYLNPDYISRIFKRETGISIRRYINQKRLNEAHELLVNTEIPIQAVAMNSGYSSFAYFTRLFRETYGYSPIEYRKSKAGGKSQ